MGAVVINVTARYLPPELVSYQDSVADAEPTIFDWWALAVGVFLLILFIVASVGLYGFKRWGRNLFLWTNVALLVISPAYGVSITSGLSSAVCYLDAMLTGGILFAMYLPPINSVFEADSRCH